jgi:hypothetical protein
MNRTGLKILRFTLQVPCHHWVQEIGRCDLKPCTERTRLGLTEFAGVSYVVGKGRTAVAKVLVLSIHSFTRQVPPLKQCLSPHKLDFAVWSLKPLGQTQYWDLRRKGQTCWFAVSTPSSDMAFSRVTIEIAVGRFTRGILATRWSSHHHCSYTGTVSQNWALRPVYAVNGTGAFLASSTAWPVNLPAHRFLKDRVRALAVVLLCPPCRQSRKAFSAVKATVFRRSRDERLLAQ